MKKENSVAQNVPKIKSPLGVCAAPPKSWEHPGGKLIEMGPESLKQAEILAIIIGAGCKGRSALAIADAILDEYFGLYELQRRNPTPSELAQIQGLGISKAMRVMAAIELGRRMHYRWRNRPDKIPPTPTEAELLARVLGSGVKGRSSLAIAEDILARFGSMEGICGHKLGELMMIKGVDSVRAIRIAAVLEIGIRLNRAM